MEFIDKLILSLKYDIENLERKLLIRKLKYTSNVEVKVEPKVEVKQETPTQRPTIDIGRYIQYYDYPSDRTNATSYFKAEPGFRPK